MKLNNLFKIWQQDLCAINAWLSIPSAWTAEIIANVGFDSCTIDLQHGLADYQIAVGMLQSLSTTDTVPLVRVPWNEPALIMRMLDAGAKGIIAPMINNRKEAEAFVGACKYPPLGYRSYGPIRASLITGQDYFKLANSELLALAMIETREALQNLEDITEVEGLDGIYVGTMDLSISLGLTKHGDLKDPKLISALETIIKNAKKKNLIVGIHSHSSEDTKLLQKLGVILITPLNDSKILQTITKSILDETRVSLGKKE